MSVFTQERLHRWYVRFPPRGAWRAVGGLIAFALLVQHELVGAIVTIVAFAVAEVVFDAADLCD
jgi:hypothetical protein